MPVARHIIERPVSFNSADILNNLQKKLSKCLEISLALDESTDIKDEPQLAKFLRYVSKDLEVMEELLDLVTLKNTTRSCYIKEALDGVWQKNAVPIGNIVSIVTNGAPIMTDMKKKLIELLKADILFSDFQPVHYIIYREHLASK